MSGNEDDKVASSRRRFLKATTKLAVYTPPAMMAVSKPSIGAGWNDSVNYRDSGGYNFKKKSKKKYSKKSSKKTSKKKATWWHDPV